MMSISVSSDKSEKKKNDRIFHFETLKKKLKYFWRKLENDSIYTLLLISNSWELTIRPSLGMSIKR